MALSVDYATQVISVPQADLTLVSGTIYRMDTETYFRQGLMDLMDDENYIWMPYPFQHNTEVVIAGVTYARTISIINGYTVQFTPDSQWTVILEGSNNDIWDVSGAILVQNQVQVVPTNSAGLIVVTTGGVSSKQDVRDAMELTSTSGKTSVDDKLDSTKSAVLAGL